MNGRWPGWKGKIGVKQAVWYMSLCLTVEIWTGDVNLWFYMVVRWRMWMKFLRKRVYCKKERGLQNLMVQGRRLRQKYDWEGVTRPAGVKSGVENNVSRNRVLWDFPGGPVVESLSAGVRDTGSIPSLGRSTCQGETKPMCHNYWAWALELGSCSYWKPHVLEPLLYKKGSQHSEEPGHPNCRIALVLRN